MEHNLYYSGKTTFPNHSHSARGEDTPESSGTSPVPLRGKPKPSSLLIHPPPLQGEVRVDKELSLCFLGESKNSLAIVHGDTIPQSYEERGVGISSICDPTTPESATISHFESYHMDVSSPAQGSNQTMKSLGPKQSTSGKNCELGFEHVQSEDTNTRIEESNPIDTECLELPPKDAIKHVQSGYKDTRIEEPNSIDTKCLDLPPKDATKNFSRVLLKENRVSAKSSKRKYILRSSVASVRVLRSRSRGTPQAPGPSNSSSSANAVREEKRKRKKQVKRTLNNEFTRTRKRLQYLLHRMSYEQSLIDAYSGEGWKGQRRRWSSWKKMEVIERGRHLSIELALEEEGFRWVLLFVTQCIKMEATEYLVKRLRCKASSVILERTSNSFGAFISLTSIPTSGGRRRWVSFPVGPRFSGWKRLEVVWRMKHFVSFTTEARPIAGRPYCRSAVERKEQLNRKEHRLRGRNFQFAKGITIRNSRRNRSQGDLFLGEKVEPGHKNQNRVAWVGSSHGRRPLGALLPDQVGSPRISFSQPISSGTMPPALEAHGPFFYAHSYGLILWLQGSGFNERITWGLGGGPSFPYLCISLDTGSIAKKGKMVEDSAHHSPSSPTHTFDSSEDPFGIWPLIKKFEANEGQEVAVQKGSCSASDPEALPTSVFVEEITKANRSLLSHSKWNGPFSDLSSVEVSTAYVACILIAINVPSWIIFFDPLDGYAHYIDVIWARCITIGGILYCLRYDLLDKIKPEKELQRAASEILSCKRKIRDLFQHIDSLCAEGRLLESLFDSEGQIDSEDILCAKCGSKELSTDNDIILCDGTCSRGFHQMCLEPPLLKEDIYASLVFFLTVPPGDEGWLCPGCDCKVDCVDLLNDVRGTDLSIFDNWEKIFPEAASVAAAGDKQDDNFGYPSDDSEDNDYDPDGPEVDEKVRAEGSSSEESDFTSASDDSEPSLHDEPYLGLPSDDSEDTDYDPNVLDHDEQVKQESSSSDFTSDSEDFSARIDDNRSPGTDEVPVSSSLDSANPISQPGERRPKITGKKKQSVNSELLSILEADPSQENAMPVSGKRHKERLDYKRLHDDAYGNVSSESSDDEDWTDNYAPRKRNDFGKDVVISPQGNSQPITNGANTKDMKWDLEEAENTLKRRTRQKLDFGGTNNSEAKTHKDSPDPGSIAKKSTTSASKSLGEAVTQRLRNSFRENVYPTRDTKENLANELGITFRQVSKWFENARRSSRQSASVGATEAGISSPNKAIVLTPTNRKIVKSETKIIAKNIDCNGAEDKESGKAVSEQAGVTECCSEDREERKSEDAERRKQQSTAPTSRKQKGMIDDQTSDGTLTPKETPTKGTQTDSRKAQTAQKSCQNAKQELTLSRVQTRNRKSVA
ncbi:hypothetical protein HHK36_008324 [Tetracentron sinense]|uniref:Uncharacterized protein n=1 Tax=Tetracentron sinense TaxID=13715 RepID=A0A834ZF72_TETSI|nr:hypothetical protein HHK36_008324 [Tetracentron sinense]